MRKVDVLNGRIPEESGGQFNRNRQRCKQGVGTFLQEFSWALLASMIAITNGQKRTDPGRLAQADSRCRLTVIQ
ncbi:MAG: hypothetical protein DYG96_10345 [Chlorobi bacterium CHB2]|nr:hypothetical protein [Chlorobi bacterium CHB2]